MFYTFRCILDTEEDVIRDITLQDNDTLLDLHKAMVQFFNLSTGEMASFYRTNDDWEQGEEVPLIAMNEIGITKEMKDFQLKDIFKNENDNLLYIYDFLAMWTFFISLHKIQDSFRGDTPNLLFSVGQLPDKAPEKHFISDSLTDFDDDFNSEFDEPFDNNTNLDDFY